MSRTVSLPDDVAKKAEELAKREGVPLDTFIAERLKDNGFPSTDRGFLSRAG